MIIVASNSSTNKETLITYYMCLKEKTYYLLYIIYIFLLNRWLEEYVFNLEPLVVQLEGFIV